MLGLITVSTRCVGGSITDPISELVRHSYQVYVFDCRSAFRVIHNTRHTISIER